MIIKNLRESLDGLDKDLKNNYWKNEKYFTTNLT